MKFERTFRIGNCHIIPIEYAIQHDGAEKETLQPKFIEVLCYLASQYPRIIPREEIIEQVWAGNVYVGEKALTNAIWHLRQRLKGAATEPTIIETIRKVGYRLLVEPQWLEETPTTPITSEDLDTDTLHAEQLDHSTTPAVEQHQAPPEKQQKLHAMYSLLLLCVLVVSVLLYEKAPEPQPDQIEPITKQPGAELFASPSPDGNNIVFKWVNKAGNDNLYLKDRHNPQLPPKQLTFGDVNIGFSVWSNDGAYLYFAKKDRQQKTCEVMQLKVETQQEQRIASCPERGGYYYIDISPDNKTLAFHGYEEPADSSGIYFLDLTNPDSQPYRFSCSNNCGYRDRDFAFSPDGKHIAVTRRVNTFNENLFLVDLATQEATQLSFGEEDIVGLTWHPDGTRIIYAAQRADIRKGYMLDIETKRSTAINIDGFSYPEFSRNSHELFFQQRSEKYTLTSLALNDDVASTPFPIIESADSHHYPNYSNATQKIAYVSNESGFNELWIADKQGQNRQQITFLKKSVRYPYWSHDGKKIAFLAPNESETQDKIYIYDLSTEKLSELNSPHQNHNRPTWTFDDTGIITAVYADEYTDLHIINIASGESKRITHSGARFGIMTSPTTLLFTQEKSGLWQKELGDNNLPLNKISGKKFKTTYSWVNTAKGVYYVRTFSRHLHITFFDFDTQTFTPIVKLPTRSINARGTLSYVPEDDLLLFTHAAFPQADIKKLTSALLN